MENSGGYVKDWVTYVWCLRTKMYYKSLHGFGLFWYGVCCRNFETMGPESLEKSKGTLGDHKYIFRQHD